MGAPLLPQLCFLLGMEAISLYKHRTAVTKSNIPHFFLGRQGCRCALSCHAAVTNVPRECGGTGIMHGASTAGPAPRWEMLQCPLGTLFRCQPLFLCTAP